MCSLFGVLDYKHNLTQRMLNFMISTLSVACEVRGTDATGVAYINHGKLTVYKRPVPARRLRIQLPKGCHVVMGHTRMTTQGSAKYNRNNHPFIGKVSNTAFALAHNGVLYNDVWLRDREKLPSTNIETDSYIAVQLIEKHNSLDFVSLRYMAENVLGSYTFSVLDKQGSIYLIKGDSPLYIYDFERLGFYLYASTKDILKGAVARMGLQKFEHSKVNIRRGDILKINSNGQIDCENFIVDEVDEWTYPFNQTDSCISRLDRNYWEELKSIANCFGYTAFDIDCFQRLGYFPDDVEEILYSSDR